MQHMLLSKQTSGLYPPTSLSSATESNWPSAGVVESFFDRALTAGANGDSAGMPADGYMNGVDGGSRGLDEWAADTAGTEEQTGVEEVEEAWDIAAEDIDSGAAGVPGVTAEDAGEVVLENGEEGDVAPGIGEAAFWARNSPLAVDHVAAGSFETAMQLLNRQVGAVAFQPLKPLFLQIYSASKLYVQANASMPPLVVFIRRDPAETDPRQILPVSVKSLQTITGGDLRAAYAAFNKAKFADCLNIFRSILHSLLLVVATSPLEENEVRVFLGHVFYPRDSKADRWCIRFENSLSSVANILLPSPLIWNVSE